MRNNLVTYTLASFVLTMNVVAVHCMTTYTPTVF